MQEITVNDKNGNSILGLVQWDNDVTIYIENEILDSNYDVHFFNSSSDKAYVVHSLYENDILSVKIPNILLENFLAISGYVYIEKDNEAKSILYFRIPIRSRPKPSNHVYIDTKDYVDIEEVLSECKELERKCAEHELESKNFANNSKSYSDEAALSASQSSKSANDAKISEGNAKTYSDNAKQSENNAKISEDNASKSEISAASSASSASNFEKLSESYCHGNTGERENENTDNSSYYYTMTKNLFNKIDIVVISSEERDPNKPSYII